MTQVERLKKQNLQLKEKVANLELTLQQTEEILEIVAEGVKDVRERYVVNNKFTPIKWYQFKKWIEVGSFAIAFIEDILDVFDISILNKLKNK